MNHEELVRTLAKPGQDICDSMSPDMMHNLHMAVGICGEAGELIDAIKKAAVYNKTLDRDNVIEELGDLEFYMEGLRQQLKISREETITNNITKLLKRYKSGKFSDQEAQDRADKGV